MESIIAKDVLRGLLTVICFMLCVKSTNVITAKVHPVYKCELYNNTLICTGAHYQMYCNIGEHYFLDVQSSYQYQSEFHCTNSGCNCIGNLSTCTCTSNTSSCFCSNNNNSITISPAVSPRYDCILYSNNTYICTGVHYRMYCDLSMHQFHLGMSHYHCFDNGCRCFGDENTCGCTPSVNSTCFCSTTTPAVTITLPDKCRNWTPGCLTNLLDQIENITVKELHRDNVSNLFNLVFNTSVGILNSFSDDQNKLVSNGNHVLKACEKLVSMLVKETETCANDSFILESVEAQVFMVGPNVTLNKIPRLNTTNASLDIDLIGIAKNNNGTGSAAVAFMSYNTMEKLLKAEFFNTSDDTSVKTMMSTVISATLPKTTNKQLTKPVNFTLKHIREFVSGGNMSCVYWNITEWIVDGCSVLHTNSNYTVCSCVHLSTFALIMQTSSRPSEDNPLMEVLNLVAVSVGLVFNSLALLTFAFCRWKPGVNNVARINLCISLLSAHLLLLLTQHFLTHIKPHQVLCNVLSGFLHFLFLSCFVWMFIEAVLLYICVKNLSQISSKQRAVLSSRFLIVIGYVIALVIVGVSVGLVPEGYGSDKCWIKLDLIWSFLGPVCVILAINTILFIRIIISLNSTLSKLNVEVSQMKQTKRMFFKTLAQFVVLGCPWILGFFTESSEVVKILFLILNSQQGTFIFLIYCLLNNEVRQQYVKWMSSLFPGLKPKTIKDAPKKR